MKSLIKTILVVAKGVFYFPHLLAYFGARDKQYIQEDIDVNAKYWKITYKSYTLRLLALLQRNRYFRNLFYCRIGFASRFFSWYTPGERTFAILNIMKGGCYVAHPYATTINAKSIGKNFTCHQCSTVGNKGEGRPDELPVIGDNVVLGAHCVVIGNVTIGDNVIIGAGSVVVKDVPSNCIVVGNPARILDK